MNKEHIKLLVFLFEIKYFFQAFMAFLVWVFAQSKHGVAMEMVGRNPRFAVASGLKLNKYRTL
ncbi:MAG: hypothetical protein QM401_07410, partial [Bacillota bacterium]|nr:hypothetical protein [Bacillota bacterium]